jgi:hypothetical protein
MILYNIDLNQKKRQMNDCTSLPSIHPSLSYIGLYTARWTKKYNEKENDDVL